MRNHQRGLARGRAALAVTSAAALLGATACNGEDPFDGSELLVAAVWTGAEQENFEEVLALFEEESGHRVTYDDTGEDTAAYLGPRLEAGEAPDVAMLPQPGLMAEYAEQGDLEPLSETVLDEVDANYVDYWQELGTVDGHAYGVMLKAAHKSLIWYRPEAFENAGVEPPDTYDELVGGVAPALAEAGETPFAMCGSDGWTLTDWFENVYLSQAGPERYDQLLEREIAWTDDSVVTALETLAEIWADESLMHGGTDGAVGTGFPDCVTDVYGTEDAAMVYEGDFVAASAEEAGAVVGEDARAFTFPAVGDEAPVVLGGDIAVAMTEEEAAQELLAFLATPEAGTAWAQQGGFLSPNDNVDVEAYPDEFTQGLAESVHQAGDDVRYDLSDQLPSGFGATEGSGMWATLQDFLRDPGDPEAIAEELEEDAAAAHGNGSDEDDD
ncbi:extracellular solute-binding protein [Lipingzhangella sp. LS1_29]|uniref:Extracellular solute-binding protein n=1 Tax=Lipingzhangella rawalii TaxID=2055835 RepID=A0ABU2H0Y6_9ACTN|nr:extracellular solute-binding protein [Lipingzhangella rawalii]MDS1268966.1 extracellular solute-binding protein [Lipingzhangella rawalii]